MKSAHSNLNQPHHTTERRQNCLRPVVSPINDFMRRIPIICLFSLYALTVSAAEPNDSVPNIINALNESGKFKIEQPENLLKRLERSSEPRHSEENAHSGSATSSSKKTGYRVEVFADNNVRTAKAQASSKRRQLQSRLPQYKVYLVFDSPFWRVRLGDFPTRSQAENALQEVRKAFPSLRKDTRIVRSVIIPN